MTQEQLQKSNEISRQIEEYKSIVTNCDYMINNGVGINITTIMTKSPTFGCSGLNIRHAEFSLFILRKVKKTYEEWIIKLQDQFDNL